MRDDVRGVAMDGLAGDGTERMELHDRLVPPSPPVGHHEAAWIGFTDRLQGRTGHNRVIGRRGAVVRNRRRLVHEIEGQFAVRDAAIAPRKLAPQVGERREGLGVAKERLRLLRQIAAVARRTVEIDLDMDAVPLAEPHGLVQFLELRLHRLHPVALLDEKPVVEWQPREIETPFVHPLETVLGEIAEDPLVPGLHLGLAEHAQQVEPVPPLLRPKGFRLHADVPMRDQNSRHVPKRHQLLHRTCSFCVNCTCIVSFRPDFRKGVFAFSLRTPKFFCGGWLRHARGNGIIMGSCTNRTTS